MRGRRSGRRTRRVIPRPWRRFLRRWGWGIYLVLLIASFVVQERSPPPSTPAWVELGFDAKRLSVPAMTDEGATDQRIGITYLADTYNAPADTLPVILLHGSPGAAWNYWELQPRLRDGGRNTYAIDLPGFGGSDRKAPSYSILSQAHTVLACMDELGLDRAHVVGWSNGSGAALHMADIAPERVATVTMLSSIGLQETEGSGSYFFEHVKYGLGFVVLVGIPDLIPHFGLLGARSERVNFLRAFWDSDQRPLRRIMETIEIPVLIVHGRGDFLIADWAAERHHEVVPTSSLVMMDGTHFLPWTHADETADVLSAFFRRHDAPSLAPLRFIDNRAPRPDPMFGSVGEWTTRLLIDLPWWVDLLIVALVAMIHPYLALVLAGFLVPNNIVDLVVAYFGILAGRFGAGVWRWIYPRVPGVPVDRRGKPGWLFGMEVAFGDRWIGPSTEDLSQTGLQSFITCMLSAMVRLAVLLCVSVGVTGVITMQPMHPWGLWGILLAALCTGVLLPTLSTAITWRGRQAIRARWRRLRHHEFWPWYIFYIPLYPYLVYLAIRHRHPLVFTCCNSGITNGGGVVGESKYEIMRCLEQQSRSAIALARTVEAGGSPAQRVDQLQRVIDAHDELSYPLILKPDSGERGYGVRLVRDERESLAYFVDMPEDVVVQEYVPGPGEVGLLWLREPGLPNGRNGRIYSVTYKTFPEVQGDGERTLEHLILTHPRYRCQAPVFLARHERELARVPHNGEHIRLSVAGNHAQGALFSDGGDLITEALEQSIDEIASSFPDANGEPGGLDVGRFDVRYTSDEQLMDGVGFAIIELNGTFGESTNLYDPEGSLLWAYGWLFGHWRRMYDMGTERRREGAKPLSVAAFIGMIVAGVRGKRREMRVSD